MIAAALTLELLCLALLVPPPAPRLAGGAPTPQRFGHRAAQRGGAARGLTGARMMANAYESFEFAYDEEEDEAEEEAQEAARVARLVVPDKPVANMTVGELAETLKQLGLRHTGAKPALVERLQSIQRKHALGLPINDMEVQSDEALRWYMLQTANGFERAVETNLNMAVRAQRLQRITAAAERNASTDEACG